MKKMNLLLICQSGVEQSKQKVDSYFINIYKLSTKLLNKFNKNKFKKRKQKINN